MLTSFLKNYRQTLILIFIVFAGLLLTWLFSREALRLAEQEARLGFENRAELYIERVSRQLDRGITAGQDIYNYYLASGKMDRNTFVRMVGTNSFLNRNRIFVGLSYPVTENTHDKFMARMRQIYGDNYTIYRPKSAPVAEKKAADEVYAYPLFFIWPKNKEKTEVYRGLDIGAIASIHDFLTQTIETKESSALLLPSFPELDEGQTGLVLLANPYQNLAGYKGHLLQLLDMKTLVSEIRKGGGAWAEGLILEADVTWGDGHYNGHFKATGESLPENPTSLFSYDPPSVEHIKQYNTVQWTMRVKAVPGTVRLDYSATVMTAIVSLLLTALFFSIYYLQGQRAMRVADIVERRTRALKEAHDELEEHYRLLQNLNKDVEEARQSAEMANRAKSEFLATMSHELRTPLNAILGFSQLLADQALGKIGDGRYVEYARDIYSSGSHLLGIINDILDLAKLEAGKVVIEHRPIEVRPLVDRVLSFLDQQAKAKNLLLHVEISNQMPDRLMGDELRLRQILINLCTNALKFTTAGSVTIRLLAKHFKDGRAGWLMEVEDTGIGIPEEKQTTLFDRFTQVDATLSRRHGGVGLGLAICRELVNRMEGHISIRSTVGIGTTVRVHLPLESAGDQDTDDDSII